MLRHSDRRGYCDGGRGRETFVPTIGFVPNEPRGRGNIGPQVFRSTSQILPLQLPRLATRDAPVNHHRMEGSSLQQNRHYDTSRRDIQSSKNESEDGELGECHDQPATPVSDGQFNHWQFLTGFEKQRQILSIRAAERRRTAQNEFRPREKSAFRSNGIKSENDEDEVTDINDRQSVDPSDFARRRFANFAHTRRPTPPSPESDPSPTSTVPGPIVSPDCRCPIGEPCPAKNDELVDCRTLVLENQHAKWCIKQQKEFPTILPPNIQLEDEPFMSLRDVQEVVEVFDKIPTLKPGSVGVHREGDKIGRWILKAQSNSVNQQVLDQSLVLSKLSKFLDFVNKPTPGNPSARKPPVIPIAHIESLTIINRKWVHGDLSVIAGRGLVRTGEGNQHTVDPEWPYARSADYYGHGHLVNGQTWRKRDEMRRDGAHAPLQAGIYGTSEEGAKSIIMGYHNKNKKKFYADVDKRERIWYIGTALPREKTDTQPTNFKDPVQHAPGMIHGSKGNLPTPSTRALITSYRTKRPVRVFRSFNLAPIVKHRPPEGYRYDGLYKVVAYTLLKERRQIYSFEMLRLDETEDSQGPLRENLPPPKLARKRKREDDDDDSPPVQHKKKTPGKPRATGPKGRAKKTPAPTPEK